MPRESKRWKQGRKCYKQTEDQFSEYNPNNETDEYIEFEFDSSDPQFQFEEKFDYSSYIRPKEQTEDKQSQQQESSIKQQLGLRKSNPKDQVPEHDVEPQSQAQLQLSPATQNSHEQPQTPKSPFQSFLSSDSVKCLCQRKASYICLNIQCSTANPFICDKRNCECNKKHSRCSEKRLQRFNQIFQQKQTIISEMRLCMKRQIKILNVRMEEHRDKLIKKMNRFDWGFVIEEDSQQEQSPESFIEVKMQKADQSNYEQNKNLPKKVIRSASDIRSQMFIQTLELSKRMQEEFGECKYEQRIKKLTEPLAKQIDELFQRVGEEIDLDYLRKRVKSD